MAANKTRRSGTGRRRFLALSVALPLALFFREAQAAFFDPRIRAKRFGDRVRVRIWISANVGPLVLDKHYLGAFYVPDGSVLRQTLIVGIATIDIALQRRQQLMEAAIKMQSQMFETQQKVIKALIA